MCGLPCHTTNFEDFLVKLSCGVCHEFRCLLSEPGVQESVTSKDAGDEAVFWPILLFPLHICLAACRSMSHIPQHKHNGGIPEHTSSCRIPSVHHWRLSIHVQDSEMVTFMQRITELNDEMEESLLQEPSADDAGKELQAEEEALEACKAAEITTLVQQTVERPETEWLSSVGDMSGL